MKNMKSYIYRIVWLIAISATLWSLYYGWFGDPIVNLLSWELFLRENWLEPCEMCWFARIFMYPIVVIVGIGIVKKTYDYLSVLILSWLWILLESYQYWFQMVKSEGELKSVFCGIGDSVSCAIVDVNYWWFITIPLLCLLAFIVIFIGTLILRRRGKSIEA